MEVTSNDVRETIKSLGNKATGIDMLGATFIKDKELMDDNYDKLAMVFTKWV